MIPEPTQLRLAEPWHVTLVRGYWLRAKRVTFATLHNGRAKDTGPVGIGNGKTALPTTYRAVGETCPTTCPRLPVKMGGDGTCFGIAGNTAVHSRSDREAGAGRDRAIKAAALALAGAAAMVNGRGRPVYARIHGVGDFGDPDNVGRVDHEYVHAIADMAEELRRLTGRRWVGFGYTHMAKPGTVPPWVQLLRDSGIALRVSDDSGDYGSILVPDHSPETMARYPNAFACPEQTHGTTCAECGACVNSRKAVAFSAIGVARKRLARSLRNA